MQGLTQTDVAERLGVSTVSVSRYERGLIGIPDRHKLALAEMFGVHVVYLMGWEDNGEVAA